MCNRETKPSRLGTVDEGVDRAPTGGADAAIHRSTLCLSCLVCKIGVLLPPVDRLTA